MAVVRWTFYDPIADESWTVPINPLEADLPPIRKNLTMKTPAGPNGTPIVFEGRQQVPELSAQGAILSEDHYTEMRRWVLKRHQVRLTTDLGEVSWIYLTELSGSRKRSTRFPWKRDYTVKWIELDVP